MVLVERGVQHRRRVGVQPGELLGVAPGRPGPGCPAGPPGPGPRRPRSAARGPPPRPARPSKTRRPGRSHGRSDPSASTPTARLAVDAHGISLGGAHGSASGSAGCCRPVGRARAARRGRPGVRRVLRRRVARRPAAAGRHCAVGLAAVPGFCGAGAAELARTVVRAQPWLAGAAGCRPVSAPFWPCGSRPLPGCPAAAAAKPGSGASGPGSTPPVQFGGTCCWPAPASGLAGRRIAGAGVVTALARVAGDGADRDRAARLSARQRLRRRPRLAALDGQLAGGLDRRPVGRQPRAELVEGGDPRAASRPRRRSPRGPGGPASPSPAARTASASRMSR